MKNYFLITLFFVCSFSCKTNIKQEPYTLKCSKEYADKIANDEIASILKKRKKNKDLGNIEQSESDVFYTYRYYPLSKDSSILIMGGDITVFISKHNCTISRIELGQ